MTQKERYEAAKEAYAEVGVDTEAAIEILKNGSGISSLLADR